MKTSHDATAPCPAPETEAAHGPAPNGSLSSYVVSRLENEILLGIRQPGERLDENQLARIFGVSRTPVRESLQRLVASGLVVARRRQGLEVARLSVVDVLDSFSIVARLEALAAHQAARRARSEHFDRLSDTHQACALAMKAEDEGEFYRANLAFHEAVAVASQNNILQDEIRRLTLKVAPYRRTITAQIGRMQVSVEQHDRIMTAIIQRKGDQAAAAMSEHINVLGEELADFLHVLRATDDAFSPEAQAFGQQFSRLPALPQDPDGGG